MTKAEPFRSRLVLLLFASLFSLIISSGISHADTAAPDAGELLQKMDHVMRGDSHHMKLDFNVKTKKWQRDYKLEVWMQGLDNTFARVLAPAKVEGQGFLRQKLRLWNYLPTAERTMLIPPSLMLDRFMGSDFTNDDLVKMSYYARDYEGKVTGEETVAGEETYHLELKPKPNAPVTYEKLELWLRKSDSAPVQSIFYNEKLVPIRRVQYSEFKAYGKHTIPAVWHMENLIEHGRESTFKITDAEFDVKIPESVFSKENLEKNR